MTPEEYNDYRNKCWNELLEWGSIMNPDISHDQIFNKLFDGIFSKGVEAGYAEYEHNNKKELGEEMLSVPRCEVQQMYKGFINARDNISTDKQSSLTEKEVAGDNANILYTLFGDKCLKDFQVGDIVKVPDRKTFGHITNIDVKNKIATVVFPEESFASGAYNLSDLKFEMWKQQKPLVDNIPAESVNLAKLLVGHEGETFYSPLLGNIKYTGYEHGLLSFSFGKSTISLTYNGTDTDGNLAVFPSKDERDWAKWEKGNNLPKTINDMYDKQILLDISVQVGSGCNQNNPFLQSFIAHLDIAQLIGCGYGGNVTNAEWNNKNIPKYVICYSPVHNEFVIQKCFSWVRHTFIAFHNETQAKEFLSYQQNIQLLEKYFMLKNNN